MAYNGETPWKGLGTKVDPDMTPEEMLKKAGLDWEVKKYNLFAEVRKQRVKTGAQALVRLDGERDPEILTILPTASWNPVQNRQAFEFFNEFVERGDMEMHTAGALMGGKHVWALAKIKNEEFELFGGDRVEGYLLFSLPHQFGYSIDIRFTPIRVVSQTTMADSLAGAAKNGIRLNHRREFNPSIVKQTLGLADVKFGKYREAAELLGSKPYTDETLIQYFNLVFPKTSDKKGEHGKTNEAHSRAAKLAISTVESQPGHSYAPGTWWNAFNTVTYLADHVLGMGADTRLYSSWYGVNQKVKAKALQQAISFAKAA